MKRISVFGLLFLSFILFACVLTSKIPVYSANDLRPKIYLKEAAPPYAAKENLIVSLDAYNHTIYDLEMRIECEWYSLNSGKKMAYDQTKVRVKSGTKKRVTLSGFYITNGTRFVEVRCIIAEIEEAK